jgi:cobalt/nickel transport system permease protein
MHLEIDRHWDKDSRLHRLDPRLRIVAVVVWAVALVWIWSAEAAAAGFLLALLLALSARIPCRDIAFRLLGVFVILSPLLIVFPLAAASGTRTTEFMRALGILLKGCAIMLLSFPLFSTSRFHVTLGGFRSLGVPRALISVFLLSYRALFIFLEDRRRMELSARTRGWSGGGGRRALALTASHVGSLLVRSLDRTDRLWHAMQTRGFVGEFPLLDRFRITGRDLVLFAALLAAPALLVAEEYLIR